MKRVIALAGFAALMMVTVPPAVVAPAMAQSQQPCGPATYSNSEQKYVGLPCTPETPKASNGSSAPCGPIAYSNAEQKYVGLPCTPETPKAEAGKPPCGPAAYSSADQTYAVIPCTH